MEVSADYGRRRNLAKWIWIPGFDDSVNPGQFVLFRKKFHLQTKPTRVTHVRVSADTRYRLFVNGKSVCFGPCKSYPSRWYYETVDIAPFLVAGDNVFSAKVLRYSSQHPGNSSMIRTATPGFILHSSIEVF
jgi:alpha-L-rhamnosidase